ncbi:helix-turn-helix domain-containing protein [uncultured Citricoccus sp.]|uniref:helix-turn-helix domain-containing protein n=1 Tax=uncultured Citricoccus sp. TaxID=614031 RepID=UPI0026056085|nr:helix-turn-helix domain-containing protein [uncultured Citricoccus sp.]
MTTSAEPSTDTTALSAVTALGAKSVAERVFTVLLSFDSEHRALTLSAISRRTNLPVATVHRLLHKLEGMGALEKNTGGTYSIGPLMWRMGILARSHDVIGYGARPLLMSLSARTESDVRVFSYFDEAAMCVDEILAASMAADRGLGEMHPLNGTAGGIAIAAQLSPETRARLRLTRRGLQDLEQRITTSREQRCVILEGSEAVEYAVPLDVHDRPPMSISLRHERSPRAGGRDHTRIAALQSTARALSTLLNERQR